MRARSATYAAAGLDQVEPAKKSRRALSSGSEGPALIFWRGQATAWLYGSARRPSSHSRKLHMTLTFFALLAAALLVGLVAAARHLGAYLKWEAHATRGDQFFGLKSEERSAFMAVLHERSGLAHAIIRLMAVLRPPPKAPPTFFYEGIGFPRTTSSRRLLEAAMAYQPSGQDVFVASHMKSGTTWTLYLLFQILQHGRGDLSDEGYGHIHAACPWLETRLAVGLDRAPRLGDPPRRIIKTHLNLSLIHI